MLLLNSSESRIWHCWIALALKSIGQPAGFDGQTRGLRNFRFQVTAYCGAMDSVMRREMEEASRSEVPIVTASMRQGEVDRFRQLCNTLVLSCAGEAMGVMEIVPDGEGYKALRRLHHACDPRLPRRCAGMFLEIMSHVFLEGEQLQSAFESCSRRKAGCTQHS